MSPFTPEQEEEAAELFRQGRTTAEVFRHFGATSIGQQSPIEQEKAAVESIPNTPSFANKFSSLIGLSDATKTFGDAIARSPVANLIQTPEQKNSAEINASVTGEPVMSQQQIGQQNIEAPTGKQLGGAALQTIATAASPAIAPIGLAAGIATGAALGYSYDVGSDLIAGANMQDTLTPGGATAVGAIAPPVLKGAMGLLKKPVEAIGRGVSNAVGDASMPNMPDLNIPPVVSETVGDISSRIKKVTGNASGFVRGKVANAERVKSAPANVQPAIRTGVDDVIIDLAQNSDDATKTAMRQMVDIAETPRTARPTAGAASVASDTAVNQYNVIVSQKKNIGTQIGELSDSLPTLKTIDVTAQQNTIIEVFKQNGITLGTDGKFVATDNFKVSDEQINVLNKIFDKVTTSNNLSAKNIHQLDQWFSSTQRTARMVDKIEDMFIKVPTTEGQIDVPIYKFFRDTFGQRLDEVAPDNLRSLNQQYRQLSNLTEDIEGTLVKNSNLETLQSTDISNPSTLRRMFGEAQSAEEFRLIYNNMDTTSRQFGYDGARADELYYFANKIRDYYPDEIPDTGLRANIGSSIMDMVGGVLNAGKVDAKDQREALKVLLEMSTLEA